MNEIRILVRTQNDAKAGLGEVNQELDKFAKESSQRFSKTFTDNMTQTFTTRINEAVQRSEGGVTQAGNRIGDTLGRQIATRITQNISNTVRNYGDSDRTRVITTGGSSSSSSSDGGREHVSVSDRNRVRVSVDVDKQSLLSRLGSFGKEAGEKFGAFFKDGFSNVASGVFSGDVISTLLKGLTVGGLVAVLTPVLGAAINASLLAALGGGVIAVGIIGALKDPRIQIAVNGVKEQLKGMFAGFAENFKGPLEDFLVGGVGGGPGLLGVIKSLQPMIDTLGKTFGRVTSGLGNGIVGFLQNALPPIIRAAEASAPLWDEIAAQLPGIGEAVGKFFTAIKNGSPGATLFFRDLLELIEWIIPKIGNLIGNLANLYLSFRRYMVQMKVVGWEWADAFLAAAQAAFGWIPGVGTKLAGARDKVRQFRKDANAELKKINDIDISIRIRTVFNGVISTAGQIGAQLRQMGYGRAAGGVAGGIGQAASGGPRSNWTWVGEQGPELVNLAPGSQVRTAGDSMRMAAGGGGSWMARATVVPSQSNRRELLDVLLRDLRLEIFNVAGGDVQTALGS